MRPPNQRRTFLARVIVCVMLLGFAPAAGWSDNDSFADLVSRARDPKTWPALRTLALQQTDAEQRARVYFLLGYREYEATDIQSATQDLRAARETEFSLSDYACYYGARAARDAGKFDQAIESLEGLLSRYPHSPLRWLALEQYSNLLVSVKKTDRALKALLKEPEVRERPNLSLELAEAYRAAGNTREAARTFQDLYCRFPLSAESDEADVALAELRRELGAKYIEASAELRGGRADIFSQNSRWQQALDEYTNLIASMPKSPLVARWELGRARALFRLRKTDQAVKLLQTGMTSSPETDPERLELLVDAAFRKADLREAEKLLQKLEKSSPQSPSYADALDAFGNYYVRRGDWRTAAKYYGALADQFPSTVQGEEAHWRRTWASYLEGDLNNARKGFSEHVIRYPKSDHIPGAFYWLGRIDEQRGALEEAKYWYSYLTHRFVQSYYATKAEIRLGEVLKSVPASRTTDLASNSFQSLVTKISPRSGPSLRSCGEAVSGAELEPYRVFRALGLSELAEEYLLARLQESDAPSSALRYTLSRHRAENGDVTLALFDARRSEPRYVEFQFGELPEQFWTLLYPREFLSIVERHAQESGLDVPLVLGLIRQESAFNPQARSVANARGLMQILPQTVSSSRRGRRAAARHLLDPEYNIRFGTEYLRGRLSALGEIPEHALAAYHAGEGRVQEWQGYYNYQEPAEFLETIPIPSTRAYVEAVLRDAGIYRRLLGGSAQFAKCQGAETPLATQPEGPLGPDAMKLFPKALIVIPLVLVLFVPVAVGITFYLMPLWLWIELNYQIESIGHSAPAEWCFVAIYLTLVTLSLGTLALLTLTRPRGRSLANKH